MNSGAEIDCRTSRPEAVAAPLASGKTTCYLFRGLLLSAMLLLFCAVAAAAEVMFISPDINVPVRRGRSKKYKIIKMTKVNEPVTLLEERDGWNKVRFKDGVEGWLPSRFLTQELPAAERLQELQKEKSQLEQKIKNLNAVIFALNAEISGLKEHRSSENDELTVCIKERDAARAESRAVEDTTKVSWFLAGSGVLLVGWLLGRLSGRPNRRRNSLHL